MDFYEVLDGVLELLRKRGRVTYRALKVQFELDDEQLEVLREELEYAYESSIQTDDRGLEWTGDKAPEPLLTPPTLDTRSDSVLDAEREWELLSYTPPHLAEKILQSKSALEGERKQVTVLFCDLANSTPLAEQIGPEKMHALLNRFFELALSEVHRYEGTVNQFLGDGFMALYGAPISHEDHARRAVLSAIGLQHKLKETALGSPYGVDCQFRIGINSGLVVVGSIGDNLRMDYSAIGDTTNLAARLQTQSEPGEILVSEATARLVEGYIHLDALEPVEVKGKTELVSIYKVLGTLPRRSPIVTRSERTLSPFVGRKRDLAKLEELYSQVEFGNGQIVGIVAEAGQGKSRLLYEFRQSLHDKQVTYLEGHCLSYGSSIPYHPIIDIVRNHCGIKEGDSSESVVEKVGIALQEVGMDPEQSAPYLLQLLGVREGAESIAQLTPEAVRTRTFETLRQMSVSRAQQRPLIFEVEDLHWVDKTSEDYLATLVEELSGTAILLLTTYRPGYQPPWLGRSYATQMSLHSLPPQDAFTLVQSTRSTVLTDQMTQDILERAQGNPFFLEELTRVVADTGEHRTDIAIPDTVQGVLSARIDRLPEMHKRLLQTASVLGREFSPRLLGAIWDDLGSMDGLLSDLKRLEFLFERSGVKDPIYVFKHALTQDVAYESLLTTRRQALHTAAGQVLETLYADHLEDAYDRLAYHYARTANAAKAVEYLILAAERAAQVYASAESVTTLQEALVQAERLPVEERDYRMLEVAIRQAESLFWSGRHQDLKTLLLGQQERLESLQEPSLSGLYYMWLGMSYAFLGEREQAIQSFHRALDAAQHAQDEQTMGWTYTFLAGEDWFAGRLRQAVEHCQQGIAILERAGASFQLGWAYYQLGLSYYFLGDFRHALEASIELEHIGKSIGNRRLEANALALMGWNYATQEERSQGIESCQQALQGSPPPFETALIIGWLGYAYLAPETLSDAISLLEQAVQEAEQYRSRQVQSWFKTYLGEAYRLDGRIEPARHLARQALTLAENSQHPWGAALAQGSLGRIAQCNGDLVEAQTYFQESLATFESIQSRFELARTHLDLASLAHTQSNQDSATTYLSTAYAWFQKLQVPKWAEHTEQLAQAYGVTLMEVELEAFEAEGAS